MFIILLRFGANKAAAGNHMEGHKAWLQQGFKDGVFALAGSLQPSAGGGIVAHNISRPDLEAYVSKDPFVAEGVVEPEIIEITPAMTDSRLAFLKGEAA